MNLQKTIIVVTVAAVGLCGVFLGIDSLRSSKNTNVVPEEATTTESKADIEPVVGLNLADPPISLEFIKQATSETTTQATSSLENTQEESSKQKSPRRNDYNHEYHAPQHRVYVQRNEPTNSPAPSATNRKYETYKTSPPPTTTTPPPTPTAPPKEEPTNDAQPSRRIFFLPDNWDEYDDFDF